jgi:hypothetical protein
VGNSEPYILSPLYNKIITVLGEVMVTQCPDRVQHASPVRRYDNNSLLTFICRYFYKEIFILKSVFKALEAHIQNCVLSAHNFLTIKLTDG